MGRQDFPRHAEQRVTTSSGRPLPPEHSDLVLDARLLPLQRLLGNALDGHHLPCGLLPSHYHLREGTAVGGKKKV